MAHLHLWRKILHGFRYQESHQVQTQLWIWDRDLTSFMVSSAALGSHNDLRYVFLCMEWSIHGLLWLVVSSLGLLVATRYNFSLGTVYGVAVLLLGICVDLVVVGIIKGAVRRPRPPHDIKDQLYEAPVVDKFSFPSGHSSRGAMLTVLWLNLCSVPHIIAPVVKLFPFVLGASRVMMGRHYLSDVGAGLILGYVEGNCLLYLPLSTINLLKQMFPVLFGSSER